MAVRAVAGRTRVDVDEREAILASTRELVAQVLDHNDLQAG